MEKRRDADELPEKLVASLQALGDVEAPPELWARISSQREQLVMAYAGADLAGVKAPDDLWLRVRPTVLEEAEKQDSQKPAKVFQISSYRWSIRRMAVAAALLLSATIGMASLQEPQGSDAFQSHGAKSALQRFFRSRVQVEQVAPEQMSPLARQYASMLGAPQDGGSSR
ncbi:MAG: hypothetical protein DWQ01_07360 [Planctomycetota bacterium]|nr:MAG: hypothetical protein DWQ01_07360 [Planctomycetota bacterium]